jgi:hypothetical protein
MKLAQANDMSAKTVRILFTRICSSQEVGRVSNQTALRGDEVGVFQNVPGDHSDDCSAVLTILDNILTVGGLARGEDRAGQPQP